MIQRDVKGYLPVPKSAAALRAAPRLEEAADLQLT